MLAGWMLLPARLAKDGLLLLLLVGLWNLPPRHRKDVPLLLLLLVVGWMLLPPRRPRGRWSQLSSLQKKSNVGVWVVKHGVRLLHHMKTQMIQ
jgi:hypothetical protein